MGGSTNPELGARLTLSPPSVYLFRSYLDFLEEMRLLSDTIWPSRLPAAGESREAFVARLLAKETAPEPTAVPESIYWGVIDSCVVGFITLRHRLTERLAQFGGNVSYEVRPSYRRQGVATAMLRLILATERARAMGQILVTCAPTNAASRRTIEANGGKLVGTVFSDEAQRETCHYWIDVADVR